jgi:Domain of unknown function (DUF4398)
MVRQRTDEPLPRPHDVGHWHLLRYFPVRGMLTKIERVNQFEEKCMNRSPRAPPRLRIATGMAGALLLVAACASTPPPTATLQAAEQAIANAEKADAGRHAAVELAEARTKLAAAHDAVQAEEMVKAGRMGEQARAEAELAAAKAEAAKAAAVNEELKRGNDAVIEETQRNSGAQR